VCVVAQSSPLPVLRLVLLVLLFRLVGTCREYYHAPAAPESPPLYPRPSLRYSVLQIPRSGCLATSNLTCAAPPPGGRAVSPLYRSFSTRGVQRLPIYIFKDVSPPSLRYSQLFIVDRGWSRWQRALEIHFPKVSAYERIRGIEQRHCRNRNFSANFQ
jgi:hypothetical protein